MHAYSSLSIGIASKFHRLKIFSTKLPIGCLLSHTHTERKCRLKEKNYSPYKGGRVQCNRLHKNCLNYIFHEIVQVHPQEQTHINHHGLGVAYFGRDRRNLRLHHGLVCPFEHASYRRSGKRIA